MVEIPEYVVRQMTIQDFDQVLQIYHETGMSIPNDLRTWFNVDPRGMFVASTKEGKSCKLNYVTMAQGSREVALELRQLLGYRSVEPKSHSTENFRFLAGNSFIYMGFTSVRFCPMGLCRMGTMVGKAVYFGYIRCNGTEANSGYILGMGSAIFFKEDLSFFGLYAVREAYRGQGVGGKILKATQDYVAGRNCSLNTTKVHLISYRDRAGFKLQSGIISLDCFGTDGQRILENCQLKLLKNDAVKIVPVDAKSVVKYDAKVHGYNRELLVTLSLQDPDCFALSAVDYKGKVKGYGMIKKDIGGIAVLGPLHADDQATAEHLTRELVANYEPVRDNGLEIMALKNNPGSVTIIEKLGLKVDGVYERLFTKKIVTVPEEAKIYSQHSLSFCNF